MPNDPEWAHEGVRVVAPDPAWQTAGAELAARVRDTLRPWLVDDVHHVGSTSVPGLAAKPILDLCAGVRSLEEPARSALEALGFHHVPPELDGQPWRRFYVLPKNGKRYAHLHLVVPSSPQWGMLFVFPARLRADPEVRAAYEALKRELAVTHANDREAYTRAKAGFIVGVLRDAESYLKR